MQRLSKSDIYPQLWLLKDVIYFRNEEEITGLLDRLINVWSRDFSSSIFIVQALQSAAHLILSTCLSALLNKAETWTHQAAQEKHFHISHPAPAALATNPDFYHDRHNPSSEAALPFAAGISLGTEQP